MSDSYINDLNEKEKYENNITLDKMTIRGLSLKMGKHFNLKQPAIHISSNDRWAVVKRLREQTNIKVEFPILFFKLTGIAVSTESYRAKSLARFGQIGALNDSSNSYNNNLIIPTNFTYDVFYLTDNFYNLISFANRWIYAAVQKNLNMSLEFDSANYDIQVELNSEFQVPEKDQTIEQVNMYEVQTQMVVHGYVSPDIPLSKFPKITPISSIVVTPSFKFLDSIEKAWIPGPEVTDLDPTEYEKLIFELTVEGNKPA